MSGLSGRTRVLLAAVYVVALAALMVGAGLWLALEPSLLAG